MKSYLNLLQKILDEGEERKDRTGVGTKSLFGHQLRFPLDQGFPLVTTKKCHLKSIIVELLWFLRGDTNLNFLHEHKVSIWDEWADAEGNLGPIYGAQWRRWQDQVGHIHDQMSSLLQEIKTNPFSRRLVVSAWNVGELQHMRLFPCHVMFQFYVSKEGTLSCHLYQRSADVFLGVPFNIASYALLTMMVAQVSGLRPGDFVHSFGDVHLYLNHLEQAKLQLSRTPLPLPQMVINPHKKSLFEFELSDFNLVNYEFHPAIPAKVAV